MQRESVAQLAALRIRLDALTQHLERRGNIDAKELRDLAMSLHEREERTAALRAFTNNADNRDAAIAECKQMNLSQAAIDAAATIMDKVIAPRMASSKETPAPTEAPVEVPAEAPVEVSPPAENAVAEVAVTTEPARVLPVKVDPPTAHTPPPGDYQIGELIVVEPQSDRRRQIVVEVISRESLAHGELPQVQEDGSVRALWAYGVDEKDGESRDDKVCWRRSLDHLDESDNPAVAGSWAGASPLRRILGRYPLPSEEQVG